MGLGRKRIVICADEYIAYGIRFAAKSSDRLEVISHYLELDLLFQNLREDRPDIAIIDIDIVNGGFSSLERIKVKLKGADVILLSNSFSAGNIVDIFSIGLTGCLDKSSESLTRTLSGLDQLNEGYLISPSLLKKFFDDIKVSSFSPLTVRETEILKLISDGKSYSQVSDSLRISIDTSRTHIKNIYKKLKVNTKSEAVKKALIGRYI